MRIYTRGCESDEDAAANDDNDDVDVIVRWVTTRDRYSLKFSIVTSLLTVSNNLISFTVAFNHTCSRVPSETFHLNV